MALIPVRQAVQARGIPEALLQSWMERGLVRFHDSPLAEQPGEHWVDPEEFDRLVESMGWLQVSQEA
jgi:hypothetical protein